MIRPLLIAAVLVTGCADGRQSVSHKADNTVNTASGRFAGLELSVTGAGALLHVVLRNQAEGPLKVYFAVTGPRRKLHDFLRAELAGAGLAKRTLRFTGDRNGADIGLVELRPGDRGDR